ncbi:ABC transporter permease [Brassicibacter mesophilus]|jgi:ABC-2 type transport system permease protein|uniref:ABC transporter permease n=1 Tax=Brassicibacter mesophilus TaxID=745119 RepID=UPI003D19662D
MNNTLKVIFSSCLLQMKQSFSRSMFRFCILAYPILFSWTLYLIYKGQDNSMFVSYVILGTAVTSMWTSISFSSAGDIDRERFMGALQVIFSSPTKFSTIMFGKVIGNTILGIFSMLLSFAFVILFFKVKFSIVNPIYFSLSIFLGIISFTFIAMMLSGLLAISRNTRVLMNCLDYPMFIFCGTVFPIEILPLWTRPISYILSPTYVLKLCRMSITGITNFREFYIYLLGLIVVTLIYFILFKWFYKEIDVKCRKQATLEVF